MRYSILLTIVTILFSCSTKKAIEENNDSDDKTQSSSVLTVIKIEFPLDSLLRFDSETELKKVFGDNIKHSTGYYPEDMGEYQNTLLFPGTRNEVEFVWQDDTVSFSGLAYINLSGEETDWKTKEGITLGTKLKELEKLNQKPFIFYGLGWDYGGSVNWDNGYLQNRKLIVILEYPGDAMPPEFEGLLGDHDVKSDSDLAQNANPIVVDITMRR